MSIAKGSQVRCVCDGFVIANRIADASQNVASSRHRCSSRDRTLNPLVATTSFVQKGKRGAAAPSLVEAGDE